MSLKFFSLTCLFLVKFFIQPTTYALPDNIQNLELDDIISQRDEFPSLIEKLEVTGRLFKYDQSANYTYRIARYSQKDIIRDQTVEFIF